MRRSQLNLSSIHRGLKVIRYSNRERHTHGGNDVVYFYTQLIGAIPPGNIYRVRKTGYASEKGYPHRSLQGLKQLLWQKGVLRKLNDKMCNKVFAG